MDKIKLICFDLNKTLIRENSWFNLNMALGVTKEEDQDLLDRHKAGEITYEEGQKALEYLYKVRGKATKENIYRSVLKYSYFPGAKKTIRYLHKKGYGLALISGSINFLVEKIAKELGIKHSGANNSFVFNKKGYFSELVTLGTDSVIKVQQLEYFAKQLSVRITDCACVGDGDNDIELFQKTGHGVTFRGSEIEKYAWKTIDKLEDLQKIF